MIILIYDLEHHHDLVAGNNLFNQTHSHVVRQRYLVPGVLQSLRSTHTIL